MMAKRRQLRALTLAWARAAAVAAQPGALRRWARGGGVTLVA
jgi:hypothetical protein